MNTDRLSLSIGASLDALAEALRIQNDMTRVLGEDTLECVAACKQALAAGALPDPFWRRALVKLFLAYVEGVTWQMSRVALRAAEIGLLGLDTGQRAVLEESSWELDDRGRVKRRHVHWSPDRRLRFVLPLYARAFNVDKAVDCSTAGWRAFREVLLIRNRLTHPKALTDLTIEGPELANCFMAFDWYFDTVQATLQLVRNASGDENCRKLLVVRMMEAAGPGSMAAAPSAQ